jgi:hypothetical protein
MNRLQKFVEQGAYGERPGRTAYALGQGNLPEHCKGMEWTPVSSFSAADEVLAEPGLGDPTRGSSARRRSEKCAPQTHNPRPLMG